LTTGVEVEPIRYNNEGKWGDLGAVKVWKGKLRIPVLQEVIWWRVFESEGMWGKK